MKTTFYVWDTYPSDDVTEATCDLPVKDGGAPWPPQTTIRLLDTLYSEEIDQDPGDNQEVEERDDGTLVLTAEFGRLSYGLYWHPTEPVKAKAMAEQELAEHIRSLG